jgi:fukutin
MIDIILIILIFIALLIILKSTSINKKSEKFANKMRYSKFIMLKQNIYKKILHKTAKVMNRLNIPFFLSSGTLLGYYREGKILDHDYDIDVGIYREDYNNNIILEMEREGFNNYRNIGDLNRGFEMSFYLPKTRIGKYAKIDIFVHNRETIGNKKYIYWASYKKPDYVDRIKYRVSDFSLKPILFSGVKVNIPSNTEKYLVEHYGKDWRTPKKPGRNGSYYYATSPTSIVKET